MILLQTKQNKTQHKKQLNEMKQNTTKQKTQTKPNQIKTNHIKPSKTNQNNKTVSIWKYGIYAMYIHVQICGK